MTHENSDQEEKSTSSEATSTTPSPILSTKVKPLNPAQMLEKGLDGYAEYKKRVKFRLIPHLL